jgi:hypothetical protein
MAEAILAQILARLGAIEKKLGVAAPSGDGDERSPLAVDFEAAIVNGPGKALAAAAAALGGDEGPKMVRSSAQQQCGSVQRALQASPPSAFSLPC